MVASCATKPVAVLTPGTFDPRVLEPCLGPSKVPNRMLTKAEVVTLFNINRDRLVACKSKHGELRRQILKFEERVNASR